MENQHDSLWNKIKTCLTSKYCCFAGRATRAEFWGFNLFSALVTSLPFQILNSIFSAAGSTSSIPAILIALVSLALILPGLGVSVRRMHDIGRSGWSVLWALLPIAGPIILLLFACKDSERGSNQYGPSEKYPQA